MDDRPWPLEGKLAPYKEGAVQNIATALRHASKSEEQVHWEALCGG